MINKYGPETSNRSQRRFQVVYARKTRERHIFMQDLQEHRKRKEENIMKSIQNLMGPKWLQALSEPQRNALDTLEISIYQDLLEDSPLRTRGIMRQLGLHPRPNNYDLMRCIYFGRNDPKEMLSQLFLMTYGQPIEVKRSSYCLNARLMLSGILYLGLNNLLDQLKRTFRPDVVDKHQKPKSKQKPPPLLESPYLQDMSAVLYLPPKRKPLKPAPLPNLVDLNKRLEEDPPGPKPLLLPSPPPPPPPPKNRVQKAYYDKAITDKTIKRSWLHRRENCKSSVALQESDDINVSKSRRDKLTTPSTGLWNAQYIINGVSKIQNKTVFAIGTVHVLHAANDLIHGGYRLINGEYVHINCGFHSRQPPPEHETCNCVDTWKKSAFEYVKKAKCKCGHHYDYGNDATFLPEELTYFLKPTIFAPFQFNYDTIYNLDQKHLFVEKEFKRIWNTDSVLCNGAAASENEEKKKKSSSSLGNKPKPEDYLKSALRHMRRTNIAAKLPDIHLVPELKEWMRCRIYGPYSRSEKKAFLNRSCKFWQKLSTHAQRGHGHVDPMKVKYSGYTNWAQKQSMNEKFRKFTQKYKLELYRSYAKVANMLWPTMYQAKFPDKSFRETYFSYLFGSLEDLQLINPYNSKVALNRCIRSKKRQVH